MNLDNEKEMYFKAILRYEGEGISYTSSSKKFDTMDDAVDYINTHQTMSYPSYDASKGCIKLSLVGYVIHKFVKSIVMQNGKWKQ